ncbi:MAG: Maf family protein [Bryobacteraceae bacterium]|nr:Maf family protein [Bryobacteraceae bacterium]
MRLVLASASPRRREILQNAGLRFEVRVAGVPEAPLPGESPVDYVRRLAFAKASAVARAEDEVVLGADTVVVLDAHILEKPRDAADAARMLRMLSGREHVVVTGFALVGGAEAVVKHAETRVLVAALTNDEIDAYVASGEPMDKAGAYAIQGLASKFIERIDGCYFNVVGLPISSVYSECEGFMRTLRNSMSNPSASRPI